ncbi:protein CFAP20DC isoform X2 [Nelusetta ayraudi]|uniref:protein CFAP20DC isoform X2 n=1 Tax=Nelusetta ayraudi TaxID=303726 RepID=UPI003F6ECFC0
MSSSRFQGGPVVELLSGQGKDPVARWKLSGGPAAIQKEYDKEVKGFVYCLEGSSQTVKMQTPDSSKVSLGLLHSFVVLQVNIPRSKDFSIEIMVTDSEHLKRRLHFSTVHKELSVNLLHAKIPFVSVKRNSWSTLLIDLVSFTGELFKGFLKLDVITLFASCKVRRIFTMKADSTRIPDDDLSLDGENLMDLIPRSCKFPLDVVHYTQVLSMESLQKEGVISEPFRPDSASEEFSLAKTSFNRKGKPHNVQNTALGSRVSGRKTSAVSDRGDGTEAVISNKASAFSRRSNKMNSDGQTVSSKSEALSHIHIQGTPSSLLPHPPKDRAPDRAGSNKQRVHSGGRERHALSAPPEAASDGHRKTRTSGERSTPPCAEREPADLKSQPATPDEGSCSAVKESSAASPSTAESSTRSIWPGSSRDPQVRSGGENNEGAEPRLVRREVVFSFLSQPHSPTRGKGQGDQERTTMGNEVWSESGGRHEARPEDDFIGSESDEDKGLSVFEHQRACLQPNAATPTSPAPTTDMQIGDYPDSAAPRPPAPAGATVRPPSGGEAEPSAAVPARCLSPNSTPSGRERMGRGGPAPRDEVANENGGVSLSQRLLREVKSEAFPRRKVAHVKAGGDVDPVDSSGGWKLHLLSSLGMRGDGGDEEELRMLASLKREQEEDECKAPGLSASQIRQCNVGVSVSCGDASTWTHVSMPANQGHHYQREMNPLRQSNPREWMDVLSPPIMPPSQLRRSGNTRNNPENLISGGEDSANKQEDEDEYLNLLYDPCLNCYFDPKTGKYYELA